MKISMKTKPRMTSPTSSIYRRSKRVVGKQGNDLLVSTYMSIVEGVDGYCDFIPVARCTIPYDRSTASHLKRLDRLYLRGGA